MSKNLDMFSSNDKQSLNIIIFDYQSKNATGPSGWGLHENGASYYGK